jgi:uncharacterized protein
MDKPHLTRKVARRLRGPLAVAVALALALPLAAERVSGLRPSGYVNDFAQELSAEGRERLTSLCREVEEKTGAQIAVVTVRTLEGLTPEEYAVQLFRQWGIGRKEDKRGVLVLLAVEDRKYKIEVGYGLEPILPDGKVGGFGREMVPLLKNRDYDGALLQITGQIAQVIAEDRGVALDAPLAATTPPDEGGEPSGMAPADTALRVALVMLVALLGAMFHVLRKRNKPKSMWGGLVQVVVIALLLGNLFVAMGFWLILIFMFFAMLLPWGASGNYRGGGWSSGGWSSGGFGGGGSSFGGFGGGSSGGGGASGSW